METAILLSKTEGCHFPARECRPSRSFTLASVRAEGEPQIIDLSIKIRVARNVLNFGHLAASVMLDRFREHPREEQRP